MWGLIIRVESEKWLRKPFVLSFLESRWRSTWWSGMHTAQKMNLVKNSMIKWWMKKWIYLNRFEMNQSLTLRPIGLARWVAEYFFLFSLKKWTSTGLDTQKVHCHLKGVVSPRTSSADRQACTRAGIWITTRLYPHRWAGQRAITYISLLEMQLQIL